MHTRGSASISSSTASRRASHMSFCCAVAYVLATRAAAMKGLTQVSTVVPILFAGFASRRSQNAAGIVIIITSDQIRRINSRAK